MIRVELTRGQIEAIVDGLPYSEHRDRGTARVVMERALKDGDGRPFPDRPPNVAVEVSPAMQAIAAEQRAVDLRGMMGAQVLDWTPLSGVMVPTPEYVCQRHGDIGQAVIGTPPTHRHAAAQWCVDCVVAALVAAGVNRVTRKEGK